MIKQEIDARRVGPDKFILNAPVVYFDEKMPARRITAPAGFFTDFLSIPFFARPFISRTGRSAPAGVIHDALYSGKAEFSASMQLKYPNGPSRKQADRVLMAASIDLGESKFAAWSIYVGVRVGGRGIWKKYRKAKI